MDSLKRTALFGYSLLLLLFILIHWVVPSLLEPSQYETEFQQAETCYRQQDWECAQFNFAAAVWSAEYPIDRGVALFNLANTHFYRGEYTQAKLLFQEAEEQGVDAQKIAVNLAFARSLEATMKQLLADIQKSAEKAEWHNASGNLPIDLLDQVAEGVYLEVSQELPNPLINLSADQVKPLLMASVSQHLESQGEQAYQPRWIRTDSTGTATTAELMSRLMRLEVGLPNSTEPTPVTVEGERPW